MKISTHKHLQFSSSQQIKEVHPRQSTPSPTDGGQRNRPLFVRQGRGVSHTPPQFYQKIAGGHIDSPVPCHVKISVPKHLQFLPSQQIKEVRPRQVTPSPTDDGQRKCPLRGLDFLLSLFPQSRQEKEKETQEKRSQLHYIQRFKEACPRQATPSPTDGGQKTRPLFVRQGRGVLHTPP